MSNDGRIVILIGQLIVAILLICYGIKWWIEDYRLKDKPFGDYENLEDCIMKNWNKRDPEQYCRKVRSKVETARRRRDGRRARKFKP